MDFEVWESIEGYDGWYGISNLGRVWTERQQKFMSHGYQTTGYAYVSLIKDKKRKNHRIHRLVARAFLPDFQEDLEVDHIDRDKIHNAVANLRCVTSSQNKQNKSNYRSDVLVEGRLARHRIFMNETRQRLNYHVTCDCGSVVQRHSMRAHERTIKHQKWLEENQ